MPEPEGWPERIRRARVTAKRIAEERQRDLPGQARLRELEQQRRALEQAEREQGKSQEMRPSHAAMVAAETRRLFTKHEQRAIAESYREAADTTNSPQRGQGQTVRAMAVEVEEQGERKWDGNQDGESEEIEEDRLAMVKRESREGHEVQERRKLEEQRNREQREQEELANVMHASLERRAKEEEEQLAKAMEKSLNLAQSSQEQRHKDELRQALQASLASSQQEEATREEDNIRRAMQSSLEQDNAGWRAHLRRQHEEEQSMARALQASRGQPHAEASNYQRDRREEREKRRERRRDRRRNRESQGRGQNGANEILNYMHGAAPDRGTLLHIPSTWH